MTYLKKWIMACGLLSVFNSHAVVYKCVDEKYTIHYQKTECNDQQNASVINVNEEVVWVDYSVQQKKQKVEYPRIDSEQVERQRAQDNYRQAHLRQCRKLRTEYKSAQKAVVQKCKKDRDIYCNQSADKIERINLNRDISKTYRNHNGKGRPRLYTPKLFQIKNHLKMKGC